MKKRLAHLADRRRELLNKIEAQRVEVAEIFLQWKNPLALADTGLKAVRFLNNHSSLVVGSLAALVAFRRKGVFGLLQKGWRMLYLLPLMLLRK